MITLKTFTVKKISLKLDIILISIILLGGLIRLYDLKNFPSGLHYDEAQSAYNGYLIANHLKNIHGEFLPTDIDYYQDFRPAIPSYLSAPFTKLLGNTESSARLPSALAGTVTIYLAFIMSFKILENRKAANLSALLLAISPYHIIFSRASADGVIDIMWSLVSIILLIGFLKGGGKKNLIFAYFFFTLGFFTYQTSRILTPLLIILVSVAYFISAKNLKRLKLIMLVLALYLIFPLGYLSIKNKTLARFNQVSTFSYPEVQRALNESITDSGTVGVNPLLVRFFHNKAQAYFQDISQRYSSFFSPQTVLYDTVRPVRYKILDVGMITILEYFGVFLFLFFLIRKKFNKFTWFIVFALLLAPIPSAVTFEDYPNFQRAIYLLPFWQLVAGAGLWAFYGSVRNRWKLVLSIFLVVTITRQSLSFFYQYFLIAPIHEPLHRNFDQKEVARFLAKEGNQYKKIGLSDDDGTYIFYLYFNSLDVFNLDVEKSGKYFQGNFKINNLYFNSEQCLTETDFISENYDLIVQKQGCEKYGFLNPIKNFKWKNSSLASTAYEFNFQSFNSFKENNPDLINCINSEKQAYEDKISVSIGLNKSQLAKLHEDYSKEAADCSKEYPTMKNE